MPHDLSLAFLDHNALEQQARHRSTEFSGLYCLGSPESEVYRPARWGVKKAVKIGKSVSILRRLNEYLLYYPFAMPGMKLHCLLCMPHAQTKEQKSNVDRAETFVLSTLKERHPNHSQWPGVDEKYRLYFSRSEWVQGIPLKEVEDLFKEVRQSGEYGPCLYVKNDGIVNIPQLWYEFRHKVQSDTQLKRDAKKAADEKNEALQREKAARKRRADEIYAPRKFAKRER